MAHDRGCPCCGKPRLTYDESSDPAIRAVRDLLAPRWDCTCWKVVECARCKRCAEHCECLAKQKVVKLAADQARATRKAERKRHPDPELPLEMRFTPKGKK